MAKKDLVAAFKPIPERKSTDTEIKAIPEDIAIEETQIKHSENTKRSSGKFAKLHAMEEAAKVPIDLSDAKRMNIALTKENYNVIQKESKKYRANLLGIINWMIPSVSEEDIVSYNQTLEVPRTRRTNRGKGTKIPTRMVQLKLTRENYNKISAGAENLDQTITQYLNTLIETYTH